MSFTLSDEQLGLLKTALTRIAADHEVTATGHRKKLSRVDAINIARQACHQMGWSYSRGTEETKN